MSKLKLIILVMFTGNILLLGLEASKRPMEEPTAPGRVNIAQRQDLPALRLLSELSSDADDSDDSQCFTVGPFETKATVDAIVEMLKEYSSSARSRQTEAFVDRGYWVFLPPYDDRRSARKAVESLYGVGLDDVALINNGEWNNSVSLGYFINQSNAAQHRDRIRDLGFPAEFRIQRDDEFRYWVDYKQQSGDEYASRLLDDLIPSQLHHPTACAVDNILPENEITSP
ncbi:MAG: hypothetical protein ACI9CB_001417 [Rhodothermales bacterium]